MTVESIKGRVAEFSKIENQWVDVPILKSSLELVKQILDHPELFIFRDKNTTSPLSEVIANGLYPLSAVHMTFEFPIDEATVFTSRLRASFKLCGIARAPQAKDFQPSLVLELGSQGYRKRENWSTGRSEKVPAGQTHVDIPLLLNLDTSDIVVYYWSRETKSRFGKNSEAVKREVEKLKAVEEREPDRIECASWAGLKGDLERVI